MPVHWTCVQPTWITVSDGGVGAQGLGYGGSMSVTGNLKNRKGMIKIAEIIPDGIFNDPELKEAFEEGQLFSVMLARLDAVSDCSRCSRLQDELDKLK